MRPRLATALATVFALTSTLATGCVTVAPHERAQLSEPEMDPSSDALEESFHSHIESAREAGFGGHGAAGGGCGCG
ncbi:DUF4266 domain-containing protein [Pseudenhygromyxa sp. WMMC2535]|uniref:DUF4266 domain-containing protein n=1 Tax=Pseudenhygromyxa sp. WMMC2535 TaxID=2712867 RepID=UPI001557B484|nr:DUF4266 domain-containing protein [Pseudenhygromyxa sp. WMMC2535]NVB42188.1 DUF4266 domain-containing protein [Pseudenhygromyxa sp. WMMC2535]